MSWRNNKHPSTYLHSYQKCWPFIAQMRRRWEEFLQWTRSWFNIAGILWLRNKQCSWSNELFNGVWKLLCFPYLWKSANFPNHKFAEAYLPRIEPQQVIEHLPDEKKKKLTDFATETTYWTVEWLHRKNSLGQKRFVDVILHYDTGSHFIKDEDVVQLHMVDGHLKVKDSVWDYMLWGQELYQWNYLDFNLRMYNGKKKWNNVFWMSTNKYAHALSRRWKQRKLLQSHLVAWPWNHAIYTRTVVSQMWWNQGQWTIWSHHISKIRKILSTLKST